jgi:hypothetical protein
MISAFQFVALSLSAFGVVSASPLVPRNPTPRGTCAPNFDGSGIIVINEANPSATPQQPAYYIQFTGQPANSYLIKPIANTDNTEVVAATGTASGSALDIVPINYNSADPLQLWKITCNSCGTPSASGGTFTTGCSVSLENNNLCIELDPTQANPLFVAPCTGASDQTWDFAT